MRALDISQEVTANRLKVAGLARSDDARGAIETDDNDGTADS